jgi:maltose alpha-D-glucosyltransferase/alpha-amylase
VLSFWLDKGLDGFRCDAVPYLFEREGTNCENLPETHEYCKAVRKFIDENYKDKVLLAEANQWPADLRPYFGDGDEFQMCFNFPLMPRLFMALRRADRHPVVDIIAQLPTIPENCQWGIFLRNHDELTLEMVTDEDRDYMYTEYATDPRMRLNLGIRRRLSPLLDDSREQIQLLNSLLFSLPGTPIIYYGDEIGMGDNIYLGDRDGVRTPMQWTGDRNAGFSRADTARLYSPVISDPLYGYQAVNVEAQQRTQYSLLRWMKRMIAVRKQYPAFGRGDTRFLNPENNRILAFVRSYQGQDILIVCNLSRSAQPVELNIPEYRSATPVELLGDTRFPPVGDLPYFLTLAPYGFYWFRMEPPAQG